MKKKGQSAMEYLMTYGWAILIVIVVVAALYSMGVFSGGGGGVPCSPCFSTFAYIDHDANTIILTSGSRTIRNIEASTFTLRTDSGEWMTPNATIGNITHPINAGTKIHMNKTAGIADGEVVTITYIVTDSGMSKIDSATLHTP